MNKSFLRIFKVDEDDLDGFLDNFLDMIKYAPQHFADGHYVKLANEMDLIFFKILYAFIEDSRKETKSLKGIFDKKDFKAVNVAEDWFTLMFLAYVNYVYEEGKRTSNDLKKFIKKNKKVVSPIFKSYDKEHNIDLLKTIEKALEYLRQFMLEAREGLAFGKDARLARNRIFGQNGGGKKKRKTQRGKKIVIRRSIVPNKK